MNPAPQNPNHFYGTLPSGDPVIQDSLEHQLAVKHARLAREKAAEDWRSLVKTDPRAAGKAFLALVSDYDRQAYLRNLEGDECLEFARGAKGALKSAILDWHANPRSLKISLISDEDLPRYVKIRVGAFTPQATDDVEVTAAVATKLRSLGLRVKETQKLYATLKQYWRLGWRPNDALVNGASYDVEPAERWQAMITADPALARQIELGALVVTPMPPSYARTLMAKDELEIPCV